MKTERGITIRTIQPGERSIKVVEGEIDIMKKRIERRNIWLSEPRNFDLSTYEAVKKNTLEMTWNLQELENELKEIKTTFKTK